MLPMCDHSILWYAKRFQLEHVVHAERKSHASGLVLQTKVMN